MWVQSYLLTTSTDKVKRAKILLLLTSDKLGNYSKNKGQCMKHGTTAYRLSKIFKKEQHFFGAK